MNKPAYIVVDEVAKVIEAVKTSLSLPNLNYLYGYLSEVNETLIQDSKTEEYRSKKYPLVWLVQPFEVQRKTLGVYGTIQSLRLIIINGSDKNWKAPQRMENNFKPVLYPIYESLLDRFAKSKAFSIVGTPQSSFTDRYYWGAEQQEALNDVFDCMDITINDLKIKNNLNCP